MTFDAPPNEGLITLGQPEPSGLAVSVCLGRLEEPSVTTFTPSWDCLRKESNALLPSEVDTPPEAIKAFSIAMGAFILGDAHGLWLEPEKGDGHCDPHKLCVQIGTRISALANLFNGPVVQSPIEAQLVAALLWLEIDWAGLPETDESGILWEERAERPCEGVRYYITPQAVVGSYKVDFMLWFVCGRKVGGIAIECDGHDFHERTKEQAARDKRRDRDLLAKGFPVMRFTGSEIFRDVVACAEQVRGVASEVLFRVSKEGGLF